MTATTERHATRAHVDLLARHAEPGDLLELRYRLGPIMGRRFYPATQPAGLIEAIDRLQHRGDVYLGCAPRARRHGGRDAVIRPAVAWVDCDTEAATAALGAFHAPPTMTIASGSPHGRHAYWQLTTPPSAARLADLNRRLAHALAADTTCADVARILRPPNTRNHKHQPAQPVQLLEHHPKRHYDPDTLLNELAPVSAPTQAATTPRAHTDDPLLAIAPAKYLEALTGHTPDRLGKVTCPFHDDHTPSLQTYPDHWYCFGCQAGGTIYDLAARLWRLQPRGRDFLRLRDRIHQTMNETP